MREDVVSRQVDGVSVREAAVSHPIVSAFCPKPFQVCHVLISGGALAATKAH
jgi:hypothetical protein